MRRGADEDMCQLHACADLNVVKVVVGAVRALLGVRLEAVNIQLGAHLEQVRFRPHNVIDLVPLKLPGPQMGTIQGLVTRVHPCVQSALEKVWSLARVRGALATRLGRSPGT